MANKKSGAGSDNSGSGISKPKMGINSKLIQSVATDTQKKIVKK